MKLWWFSNFFTTFRGFVSVAIGIFLPLHPVVAKVKLFSAFTDAGSIDQRTGLGTTSPSQVVIQLLAAALQLLALAFLVLLLYGGFRWMLSRGNEQDVTAAKGILKTAFIGLLIVLSALGIAQYVFGILEGATQ